MFRPIKTRSVLQNNLIFTNQGLDTINNLDPSQRPADILNDPNGIAASNWDSAFTSFAGINGLQFTVYNYVKDGSLVPAGLGSRRDYRYYETEGYGQDSWKVRRDLTITFGLRYGYDSVPYEINGNEATADQQLGNLLTIRKQNGLAGISGNTATPLLTYNLSGKANHAPGLYNNSPLNFSPRLAVAWNPSFHSGLFGSIFGDRKTVLRLGASQIYDHTALSAVNFAEDQNNYIFSNVNVYASPGTTGPSYMAASPRFTSVGAEIVDLPAPPFQKTIIPNTAGSGAGIQVFGTESNSFGNFVIDPNYKTPYSYALSAGFQRELPGDFQLEVDYVGRLAHRLSALADGGQLTDFTDPASKTTLVNSMSSLELAARANADPATVATAAVLGKPDAGRDRRFLRGYQRCVRIAIQHLHAVRVRQ